MTPRRLALLLMLTRIAVGCAADGPLQAVVVDYTGPGEIGLRTVELRTVTDLETLSGEVTTFRGQAEVILDLGEAQELETESQLSGQPITAEQLLELTLKDRGEPVSLAWIERDGVVYPEDYDSLCMLSAYYHMERSWLWLEELGLDPSPLGEMPTFYEPKMVDETASLFHVPLVDNAAYFSAAISFILLPSQELDGLPLAANPGVISHEYAHAVFDWLVFDRSYTAFQFNNPDARALGYVTAFNEGTADYLAAARLEDPQFFHFSEGETDWDRDLRKPRHYSTALDPPVGYGEPYDPYALGSVWAAALWSIGQTAGHDWTAKTLLAALQDLSDELRGFSVGTLPAIFARHAGAHLAETCTVLKDRFAAANLSALEAECGAPGEGPR